MSTRHILLASFIPINRVEWFYGYMEGKHDIRKRDIFRYEQSEDVSTDILTFRFTLDTNDNINFNKLFPNAMLIHKKGDALYTINGLNKLIESENEGSMGNLNHSDIKIDWSKYQNNLIMVDGEKLVLNTIERIV